MGGGEGSDSKEGRRRGSSVALTWLYLLPVIGFPLTFAAPDGIGP